MILSWKEDGLYLRTKNVWVLFILIVYGAKANLLLWKWKVISNQPLKKVLLEVKLKLSSIICRRIQGLCPSYKVNLLLSCQRCSGYNSKSPGKTLGPTYTRWYFWVVFCVFGRVHKWHIHVSVVSVVVCQLLQEIFPLRDPRLYQIEVRLPLDSVSVFL